jgi:hypothetical protein
MRQRLISALVVMLMLSLGATGIAYGQGGTDTSKGSMVVEVLDSSGGVIQNANVTLAGPTGTQKASTDIRGQAVFYGMIPGNYSVKAEFKGFRVSEVQDIPVTANQRNTIQVKLEPGAVSETVMVTGTATQVDTTTTTTGANITEATMANLPLARNITALFAMAPGVAGGGGTGVANPSISGASGLENQYIIDGVNATDTGYGAFGVWSTAYGSLGTGVNFDFVQEIQIKSGGFEAQYGQATGGVVNIVTRSGSNAVHGAVYAYLAPAFAEAGYKQVNDLRTGAPQAEIHSRHAYDIGFNVGGPFIKNKLFWYGSFDPSFSTRDRLAPKGFALRDQGIIPWDSRSYNWVGKLNYEISPNHHIEGTAFGDPSRDPMTIHATLSRNDQDNRSSLLYGSRNWAVKYNALFGPKTVFTAQFAWNHTYFFETPEKPDLFSVRNYAKPTPWSSYTYEGGVGYLQNNSGNNKQYTFMLTRNLNLLGGHQIDLGYGFNQIGYDNTSLYTGPDWLLPSAKGIATADVGKTVYGGFFYARPNRAIAGVTYPVAYLLARGNYSNPTVSTWAHYQDAFIQDAWQINRHLTAKLGLRWEEQQVSGTNSAYTMAGNWAPRLGFIIDPKGDRRTKLFANWGRFFEKVPQDLAVRAMSSEMAYMNGYFTALPPSQATVVPGTAFSPYNTIPTIWAGGTKAEYQQEIVAGAEHEFSGGIVVSARFIHRTMKRIIEDISGVTVEANLAGVDQASALANPSAVLDIYHNPVECTSGASCNPDTGYTYASGTFGSDGVPDTFPDPRRVYKSFELTAEKRFASNWSLMANYRLAKLFGNYEGSFRNDNGQSDPNITSLFDFMWSPALGDQFKIGPLPTDRRHIVNAFASYIFKGKLNLGVGWNIQSGTPLSKLMAHPDYGNAGEVPVGGRGAFGRSPTQNYWDMRVDYRIPIKGDTQKLRLAADLFDVFNRQTISNVDQNFELSAGVPNPDYMTPLSYHRPFYARFSLRYEF